ncbi:MAG: hypothetical protein PF569_02350 [Candidatus Woesearchaeota archaeon]|jgi:hypothetical protein|nr:hypothetical protein [Candidatus Woesearchaeota archaeon]
MKDLEINLGYIMLPDGREEIYTVILEEETERYPTEINASAFASVGLIETCCGYNNISTEC